MAESIRDLAEELWDQDEIAYSTYSTLCDMADEAEDRTERLEKLLGFFLGCLLKGHVRCDTCAFRTDDICGSGKKVVREAVALGIDLSKYDIEGYL